MKNNNTIENPLVSIIIPVYNGANYLREAIDSALAQSYENCEILVINDGSQDNDMTEKIALSYGDQIRYFSKENGGVSSALNVGISNMRGEYFSWLSHDDIYYKEKIEYEIDALKNTTDKTQIVQCEYEFWDIESGICTKTNYANIYSIEQLTNSAFTMLQLTISACGGLIHKSHFERVGLFNEELRYAQDIEMWIRLLRGQKSIWVNKCLFKVRIHSQSDSKTQNEKIKEEIPRTLIKILEDFTNDELSDMFGSPENAICRINGLILSLGNEKIFSEINRQLCMYYKKSNHYKDVEMLKLYLKQICNNVEKEIWIYGAGRQGIRIQYELQNRQVNIKGFIDSNPKKWGNITKNIECVSIDKLICKKNDILIIVAHRTPDQIIDILHEYNFSYIITRQKLDGILSRLSPQL